MHRIFPVPFVLVIFKELNVHFCTAVFVNFISVVFDLDPSALNEVPCTSYSCDIMFFILYVRAVNKNTVFEAIINPFTFQLLQSYIKCYFTTIIIARARFLVVLVWHAKVFSNVYSCNFIIFYEKRIVFPYEKSEILMWIKTFWHKIIAYKMGFLYLRFHFDKTFWDNNYKMFLWLKLIWL